MNIAKLLQRIPNLMRLAAIRPRLAWGVEPVSGDYAAKRGTAIHRYYLGQFLGEFSADIRGHCLEFQDPGYTLTYGGDRVHKSDVIHLDDTNPRATIIADISQPNDLKDAQFDCIICTHVMHVVMHLPFFVSEAHRLLKPGGVLLTAVPCTSMISLDWPELWRFTSRGMRELLATSFRRDLIDVRGYGNSLAAIAELRGMATRDIGYRELNHRDPRFEVEVCGRAQKA